MVDQGFCRYSPSLGTRDEKTVSAVVVGDVMLDSWLRGSAERPAQEAPVPVTRLEAVEDRMRSVPGDLDGIRPVPPARP
ncbi:hypothetical protein ACFFV7_14550 [Nonomuraea spiralis]|uniref:Uncharacterized protein n=1 Tax=Nonomuraea spiralis TaxID=46182 RepID=A0ABV5ID02_9ACTN|nr:hypothetical protein [Nonomuraea spiralis]GGT20587.1 hypothetical protein GCM10010176_076410 [Nonomuraea spiralis]